MNRILPLVAAAALLAACGAHEYTDPSLEPFKVEWASCNVGASAPEEAGTYFAWAETAGKDHYSWDNYRYSTKEPKMTKYNFPQDTPGTTYLEAGDDAATAVMGSGWRTPNKADWEELKLKGVWSKDVLNGVAGIRVTSRKTGETLVFLPAAGMMQGDVLTEGHSTITVDLSGKANWTGGQCHYWTSELWNAYCPSAWYFGLDDSGYGNFFTAYRSYGMCVRAVRDKK